MLLNYLREIEIGEHPFTGEFHTGRFEIEMILNYTLYLSCGCILFRFDLSFDTVLLKTTLIFIINLNNNKEPIYKRNQFLLNSMFFLILTKTVFWPSFSLIPPENFLVFNFKVFIQPKDKKNIFGLWLSSSADEGVRWGSGLVQFDINMISTFVGRYISMCSCFVNLNLLITSLLRIVPWCQTVPNGVNRLIFLRFYTALTLLLALWSVGGVVTRGVRLPKFKLSCDIFILKILSRLGPGFFSHRVEVRYRTCQANPRHSLTVRALPSFHKGSCHCLKTPPSGAYVPSTRDSRVQEPGNFRAISVRWEIPDHMGLRVPCERHDSICPCRIIPPCLDRICSPRRATYRYCLYLPLPGYLGWCCMPWRSAVTHLGELESRLAPRHKSPFDVMSSPSDLLPTSFYERLQSSLFSSFIVSSFDSILFGRLSLLFLLSCPDISLSCSRFGCFQLKLHRLLLDTSDNRIESLPIKF
ncbi:hypothetical protein VP01_1504g1 [Puccinia sorghi]|uniref:Uncharacterized protein n=1 Tax=Puccinia sorghi TaxID=27349 RepID=A0A0L6VIZ9_9BASI|nr:hypothetical protein VP01_1504g1 [Puccinia sorghi]